MPRQRLGIVLIASAAVTASVGYFVVTLILAILGAFLVDE